MLLANIIYSQEEPVAVKRSSNKILIGGSKFYVHVVKEKQTLYSICKAYNVTQEELVQHNPAVSEGLKAGQVLKIPFKKQSYETVQLDTTKYKYHIIQEEETLYSLSKTYNIPVEIITKHNPEVEYSNLQINQVIKIPKKLPQKDTTEHIKHKVKKKETLYSLSRKYNVPIDKILDANKQLKEEGLHFNQVINIPLPEPIIKDTTKTTTQADSLSKTLIQPGDSTLLKYYLTANCDTIKKDLTTDTINVALLMPFMTALSKAYEKPDTIWINKEKNRYKLKQKESIYPTSLHFLEFYEGVLLALEELKKTGLSVHLQAYDTQRDSARVVQILNKVEMQSTDLIIGPVYSSNLSIAAEFALDNKVPVVSPLSSNFDALKNNPYCFQVNPSLEYELDHYMAYISRFYNKNIVMVYENHIADVDLIKYSREKLMKYYTYRNKVKDVVFKEVVYNDTTGLDIEHALKKDTANYIIIPSCREAIVSSVLGKLNALKKDYSIKVFGMPVWPRFRNIDLENYYNLNMLYYTPFYIDFNDEKTKQFIYHYRNRFHIDPYKITAEGYNYCMMGYDIAMHFIHAIGLYGKDFRYCINEVPFEPIQTGFNFCQLAPCSGFENRHLIYIEYLKNMETKIIEDTIAPSDMKSINQYIYNHPELLNKIPEKKQDTIF